MSNIYYYQLAISPAFSATTLNYAATVAYEVTGITIVANPAFKYSTISGDGVHLGMSVGANVFNISVTAEDGSSVQNYVLTVTRNSASHNANLGDIGGIIGFGVLPATATTYSIADFAVSANYSSSAGTAHYAISAGTAAYAVSAGYATAAGTAVYAVSAGTAAYAISAGYATAAGTAIYATSAGTAAYAVSAGYATAAGTAVYAVSAGSALYASQCSTAVYASQCSTAQYSVTAGSLSGLTITAANLNNIVQNVTSGYKVVMTAVGPIADGFNVTASVYGLSTIGNIIGNPAAVTTGIVVITNLVSASRQRLNIYKSGTGSAVVSADGVFITLIMFGT